MLCTTASQDVQGLQEGAPRYQHDFMELAVLWAIGWCWGKDSFDQRAHQKLGGRMDFWRWWMEALTDISPTVLDRMVPHVYVLCISWPWNLNKVRPILHQLWAPEAAWSHDLATWSINKVLQHSQSWGRKPDKTVTYTLKNMICWGKFSWEKGVL